MRDRVGLDRHPAIVHPRLHEGGSRLVATRDAVCAMQPKRKITKERRFDGLSKGMRIALRMNMSAALSTFCGGALIAGGILCWVVACGGASPTAGPPRTAEIAKATADGKTAPNARVIGP